jgi:glucose-1-phosphate thymidylyltransferase
VFEAVHGIQPSRRGELEITDAIQWLVDHDYVVRPHVHEGWWIDTGRPIDMLEANASVLDEITPCVAESAHIEQSQIDRRVTVQAGAQILNSIVRGPTIIGENAVIRDSYIGPYTSIYHDVTIESCEIDRCIVLEHSTLRQIAARLHNSLIGRHASVTRRVERPITLSMNLGDHSTVEIV